MASADRRKLRQVVELVGASSPDAQLAFLHGLLSDPTKAEAFLQDPQTYAAKEGVVVDPDVVRAMVDTMVFGEPLAERMAGGLGPEVTSALLELRGDGRAAALPVAVAAAVAVAGAAVALVAQAGQNMNLTALKGIDRPRRIPVGLGGTAALIYAVTSATVTLVSSAASASAGMTVAREGGAGRSNKGGGR